MKKFFKRRAVAFLLTACIIFTMIPMSVMSTSAAQVDVADSGEFSFSDSTKGFALSNVYTVGLCACGTVLQNVASMTGDETVQKVASAISVWVFGTNPNADILNAISKMCTQILSEVTQINEKLDIYTADIKRQISQAQYTILEIEKNNAWQRDVVDVMNRYNIRNAYEAFFNLEALDETKLTTEEEMSYLVASIYYKSGETDKSGNKYTQEDVKAYRDRLFTKFCDIHGGIPDTCSREEKERLLFETLTVSGNSMDTIMLNAITELSDNLTRANSDSYSDACAQIAMQGLVNLADQREYLTSNLNKQVLTITIVEMMYQEYLSMRGDYLEKYYDKNDPLWIDYYNDVHGKADSKDDSLKSLNEHIKNKIENRIKEPVKFSARAYLTIGQLPTHADLQGVMLRNTSYMPVFDKYRYEQPILDYDRYYIEEVSTKANFVPMFVGFEKLPVYTQNGIEMYYIRIDEEFSKNNGTPKLAYGDFGVGNDWFYPSCDFFNLVRGNYSDGVNNFVSPSLPIDEASLFSTESYSLSGSVPANYLYDYCKDYTGKPLYQIFPSYIFTQNGAFRDPHAKIAALDMTKTAPSLNLSLAEQTKISTQDTYEGYGDFANGYYYAVVLKNKSTSLENKLSFETTGVYSADIVVEKSSDNSVVTNDSTVDCGEPLRFKFKATNDNTKFVSLKLQRYNNTNSYFKPTSEEVILTSDDFDALKYEDGYYVIDVNMPYSNAKFVLETDHTIRKNENGDFLVSAYDDLLTISEKVSESDSEYVYGNFILSNDIVAPKYEPMTVPIGTQDSPFRGTFDGNGYTISGLSIKESSGSSAGLFGTIENATIKNLNIADADVEISCNSDAKAGVMVGEALGGSTISNCTVSGSIEVTGAQKVGGLCGYAIKSKIEKCINYCSVESDADFVGGLVGASGVNFECLNCANFGDILCHDTTFCGGIVSGGVADIRNCYNIGKISGTFTLVGGTYYVSPIIGDYGKPTTNCYVLDNNTQYRTNATVCTIEQFKSGEVTYLLNNKVVDGTQAWYQWVDTWIGTDDYPSLIGDDTAIVYRVYRDDVTYTNHVISFLGDADLDERLTVMDVTLIQKHCAELCELKGLALKRADATNDSVISISDATDTQLRIAGLL